MTNEAFVMITLVGDYFNQNGVKVRRTSSNLDVGRLNFDGTQVTYIPKNSIVTDEESVQILNLAIELQQKKETTDPNLDTESIALRK